MSGVNKNSFCLLYLKSSKRVENCTFSPFPALTVFCVPALSLFTCLLLANSLHHIPFLVTHFFSELHLFFCSAPKDTSLSSQTPGGNCFTSMEEGQKEMIAVLSASVPLKFIGDSKHLENEIEVATSCHDFMRLLLNVSEVFQYCWLLQLKCQDT